MKFQEFQVRKNDIAETRLVSRELAPLKDGEALAKIERFAFTANNITYGVVGERIGYWKFFPAEDGWGIIPVWGFAEIVESKCDGVTPGERLYGYFPMGTHLRMTPSGLRDDRLFDAAAHRAELPPVYNAYARLAGEDGYDRSIDDERAILFPLFATSYCLYDFLIDNKWFGGEQAVIVSASSKTSAGLAYALHGDKDAPETIGVTSARNVAMVKGLGLYDGVVAYEDIRTIDASRSAVIIDMSGNGSVLSDLHDHLGDNMKYCSNVGVTHWDENEMGPGFIAERSAMFFAPGHIQKRAAEWGPRVFDKKARAFWREAALKSRDWMRIEETRGMEKIEDIYHRVRDGRADPATGLMIAV